ncbi:hypothetical protein [Aquirhabdus parva]|uniref:Uncharacterized protein n=1 Tax=Aquirhabdus parva TaxID=2283318 RepID=A0A345P9G7_9GAMM|nr:hypothetical protein [Aquirhabdus parva]AXI03926.1 hypothetical protein HYN46_14420 [Aquirhabdus parva]
MVNMAWRGMGLLLLGLSFQVPAAVLDITGVPTLDQGSEEALVKRFQRTAKGDLRFKLDQHAVWISPWPQQLPQRLAPQYVSAQTMVHPAGPIQRVTFRKPSESAPWLILTANGGLGSQLLPGQTLGKVYVDYVYLLKQRVPLRVDLHQAVILRDEQTQNCWQFILLGTAMPQGLAKMESEPRADWAMRRLATCPSKIAF